MSSPWNEIGLSEDPAVDLLRSLGYEYLPPDALAADRESLRDVILVPRLEAALRKLNPWIIDDNLHRAVRAVTHVPAASLLEANEALYVTLTYGISVTQKLADGNASPQVRFFDFDDADANDLHVTRQFRVRGARREIIPDVVVFVNGVPLAVIECKSPTIGDKWKHEALDQLLRYQEHGERHRGLGAPRLFHSVQFTVATCGEDALYATVATPERYYARWRDPHPLTADELAAEFGRKPTAQDVLLYGVLSPANLLDLTRNFVVFDRDKSTGRTVKKVARYKQFAAVDKAIERVRTAKRADERGGVVWHTQGSGKSLTMQWLAMKLRRDPTTENPTMVIVTDRRDLDKQITEKFRAAGYPEPERAKNVAHLRRLLSGPPGRTVMSTVQKFQEAGGVTEGGRRVKKLRHPVLTEAANVFVLTDEAHRTQYGSLAANLRAALPNAVFLGFTGTPIDKKDRSTLTTFGPYIDQYTVEQAVKDEATVPIFYEGRLPELRIVGQSLDRLFDRVFADYGREEREAIKSKYATDRTIAAAPKRIEAICLDLVEHYQRAIEPGGFKAQVVAVSREAAVTYKETLDRIQAPASAVVISEDRVDKAAITRYYTTERQRKELRDRFVDADDPLKLLVVCDMLLTGFDAPVEQVMYLDSGLKEHTLLQAIARVNRRADGKDYGLVVDYWGVSEALQEALEIFSPGDVQGAMKPKSDELPRLQSRHAAAMRFFAGLRDKGDLGRAIDVLEPEDVRSEFELAFRRFSQSMDMFLPDPRALDYADDLRWLGKIRQAARARFRDRALDLAACGDKVRRLIEEAIVAEGIEVLVREVSIFSADFDQKLESLKSDDARASEMEHGIRHEIHVHLEEDPVFYRSLRERLEKIIEARKARRVSAARQLELFESVKREMLGRADLARETGLSETGLAIYGLLAGGGRGDEVAEPPVPYGDEPAKALAEVIEETVADDVRIVDWVRKDDVQRDMRRRIKRHLTAARYGREEATRVANRVLELLKAREGR